MTNEKLIVDTNLLLLFFVGSYDVSWIVKFKRTRKYDEEDFITVKNLMSGFKFIFVTPQILAEVSNLSLELKGPIYPDYFAVLIQKCLNFKEFFTPMSVLLQNNLIMKIGFTDSSILESAIKNNTSVLTDDFELHGRLNALKVRSINLYELKGRSIF